MAGNQAKDRGSFEQVGEAMGEAAGKMAGRMTDIAMDVTGSVFNSMASMFGSWWSSSEPTRAASTFGEEQDRACRQHFQSSAGRSDYSSARPLYQFGHVAGQNPDYRNRSFKDVEPQLRQAWQATPDASRHGTWEDVSGYVGFGFDPGSGGI